MTKRQLKKLMPHIKYLTGFSGKGPTLLDVKPPESPKLTPKEKLYVDKIVKELQPIHWDAFTNACIDVLGEDPNDWDVMPDDYDYSY